MAPSIAKMPAFNYLQLLKREATASPNAAVILDSGTSHNWAQLVNWPGSNSSGFLETGLTTAELAAGLIIAKSSVHTFQPIAVDFYFWHNENCAQERIYIRAYLVEVNADATLPVLVEV
jgi:hypothetical protein